MLKTTAPDPVALTRDLIRRESVTPADGGAMDVVQAALEDLGFRCRRMPFGGIENLYARLGEGRPNLCFAGHTDVVPVGDAGAWSRGPFEAAVDDGVLTGRGAVDMKSAIAAFIAAVARAIAPGAPKGSISLLITGDEEGAAVDGTRAVVAALAARSGTVGSLLDGEKIFQDGERSSLPGKKIRRHGERGSLPGEKNLRLGSGSSLPGEKIRRHGERGSLPGEKNLRPGSTNSRRGALDSGSD